jgi:hypothetical protein
MAFRERIGCFFLAAGAAVALMYGIPLWSAFARDPQSVSLDWLAGLGVSLLVLVLGWKLLRAGRQSSKSLRRPSLAERAWNRWHESGQDSDPPDDA